jgi:hypothetical protein
MTLEEVAQRCDPPTTSQTIGRLETGTRTVSVGWLNRIANALQVEAKELVEGEGGAELQVAAILSAKGAVAPTKAAIVVPPRVEEGYFALLVGVSIGDYRSGDEIWCTRLDPDEYSKALNRDVLVPRPSGRFMFGRLINRDEERLQILPLETGGRQQVVATPPWLGVAMRLIRSL